MGINQKAWAILSENEKTSLSLQFVDDKSSWEAGEIMDKSHYKYLEIKYRAQKFLKMFTEHFDLYADLMPDIKGEAAVKKYLELCMGKRMKPMEAIAILNDNNYDRVYTRVGMNERLANQINKWGRSEDPYTLHMFNLVKEFDRWNNFRILPREVQEPSAFKRRVKNMYKKHLRVLREIPSISLEKLIKISKPKKGDPIGYMPIITKDRKVKVVKVRMVRTMTDIYNDICLYTFDSEQKAFDYIRPVYEYLSIGKKECKDGINFWNVYREKIQTATNYTEIQNITATRSHLEMAYSKLVFY